MGGGEEEVQQNGQAMQEFGSTYRLGSIGFPAALFLSFFNVAGPRFAKWSADGLVMMLSQMTAWFVALPPLTLSVFLLSGHSAVMYTNTCLVFHVNRLDRSASRLNLMMAYSSFLDE